MSHQRAPLTPWSGGGVLLGFGNVFSSCLVVNKVRGKS